MKAKIPMLIALCLLTAIVVTMVGGVINSWQSGMPVPRALRFVDGEFSKDQGATWQPLDDRRALRRAGGEVVIRGHVDVPLEEDWCISLHLHHMKLEVLVNDALIYSLGTEFDHLRPEWCADQWALVRVPAIGPEDVLEIRLEMHHSIPSAGIAVEKLVDQILIGDAQFVYQWFSLQNTLPRSFGQLLLVVGITLLGVSIAASIMKSPLNRILMCTALLALGEGAYWIIDASVMADYVGGSIAFYALGRSMCQVLIMYALLASVSQLLLRSSQKSARWLTGINGAVSCLFVVAALVTGEPFCRYETLWGIMQIPFLVGILILCIPEVRQRKYTLRHRFFIMAHMLVFAAFLFNAASSFLAWGVDLDVAKVIGGVVALCYAFALFIQLPASHAAVQNAKKMSEELGQNRIVLAMSQISTHFIFNVLNAISGLLKIDPELADAELVRFARYLRTNIDIMQEDKPISFEKEMEHVHNYVDLEQLRFDEKIEVEESYEVTDFMLPSLVVQPLVENAIKHGLLPKADGGLIRMSTYRQGREVVIEIADNGVGFNSRKTSTHNSVGLSNVRYRLEKMAAGRLEIESRPGIGTVAKAILPYQKEEEECI